ncbi:hypothetical protein [Bifidobacterium breve]|uniref:hypothetical protein n=1 Tax=Bifidobacterium breve TaxID=1685 RepID=UPI0012B641B9|nr:hypothetical protein [Bifidobacterium breve]
MKFISPIQWLQQVIFGATRQAPMVNYQENTPRRGSYTVSLSINAAGMREEIRGETVIIHVNSSIMPHPRVAAADAVRKCLIQIEAETRHAFPDYSYFKIKAFQQNLPVTEMPKRISPSYESPIVCN